MNAATRDAHGIGYLQRVLAGAVNEIRPDAAVEYVSDTPADDPSGRAVFFGTQYALAPRLLVEEGAPVRTEWIVGVFDRERDWKRYAGERGWTVARELDRGIILFRRQVR